MQKKNRQFDKINEPCQKFVSAPLWVVIFCPAHSMYVTFDQELAVIKLNTFSS